MSDGTVKILDGNTFVVSDEAGDIEASPTDPTGLFSYDTRFLSTWVLTINGERLSALSVDDLQYFETRFFLIRGTGKIYINAKLSVIRRRAVSNGFHEQLTILNHDDKPAKLTVRIEAACDFADLFEVKDALQKQGKYSARIQNGSLLLGYDRGPLSRVTTVTASAPHKVDRNGLTFKIEVEPQGEWSTDLDVIAGVGSGRGGVGAGETRDPAREQARMRRDLDRWLADAPTIECDWDSLKATYRRSRRSSRKYGVGGKACLRAHGRRPSGA